MSRAPRLAGKHVTPGKPQSGFTLIELLVTISLILLLTGMTVPVFTVFSRRQDLAQATKQVKVVLRDAQNRAASGVKDGVCPTPCRGDWGVDFDAPAGGPYKYRLFAVDLQQPPANFFGIPTTKLDKTTYTLPSSVTISLFYGASPPTSTTRICVAFTAVSGQVGLYQCDGSAALSLPLRIDLNGEGGPRSVIVEANGRIYEQ